MVERGLVYTIELLFRWRWHKRRASEALGGCSGPLDCSAPVFVLRICIANFCLNFYNKELLTSIRKRLQHVTDDSTHRAPAQEHRPSAPSSLTQALGPPRCE